MAPTATVLSFGKSTQKSPQKTPILPFEFELVGSVSSATYHAIVFLLKEVATKEKRIRYKLIPLLPMEYRRYIQKKCLLPAKFQFCCINTETGIFSASDFCISMYDRFSAGTVSPESFQSTARLEMIGELRKRGQIVSLKTSVNGKLVGTILIECSAKCPETTLNFIEHVKGLNSEGVHCANYVEAPITRIVKDGWFECHTNITQSKFASKSIPDENYCLDHDGPGIVSMTNVGPNTASTAFMISFKALPILNGKAVAFGKVVDGWEVIEIINDLVCEFEKPMDAVTITASIWNE